MELVTAGQNSKALPQKGTVAEGAPPPEVRHAVLQEQDLANLLNHHHPVAQLHPLGELVPADHRPLLMPAIQEAKEAGRKPPPHHGGALRVPYKVPSSEETRRFGVPWMRERGLKDQMRGPGEDWRRRGCGLWP